MAWNSLFSPNKRRARRGAVSIESMETRVLLSAHAIAPQSNGPLPNYAGTWNFKVTTLGEGLADMIQSGKAVTIDLSSLQEGTKDTANIKHDKSLTFKFLGSHEGSKVRGTLHVELTGANTLDGSLSLKAAGAKKVTYGLTAERQP